jgi:hypothetical protein
MKSLIGLMGLLIVACEPARSDAEAHTDTIAAALPPAEPTPELVAPMSKLGFMRGVWMGPATGLNEDGSSYAVTQTERMGPMLGGDIVVIEGRGYRDDETTAFNAFGVVSWNPRASRYEMRSYAQGHAGTFELKLTPEGYTWEIPAGPDRTVRFTATVKNGHWREVGELVVAGKPTLKNFEMNLRRVADTDWPLGTPVPPSP